MTASAADTLRSRLRYEPKELSFGTSGRRGEVIDLTQLETYINASAELAYLQSLPVSEGGITRGDEFYFAYDLRPSSTRYVQDEQGRGEICQAVERAIRDSGMSPVNLGCIPTPALTYYAVKRERGSIMVTGSHIPFSRNGYKVNTARGELLKHHEAPINTMVSEVRRRLYAQPFEASLFDEQGRFKEGHQELPPESAAGAADYLERYARFWEGATLRGKRILIYQHSAVGRDLLVDILRHFDAEVIPAGRSDTFVPIDTENIDAAQLATIQELAQTAAAKYGPLDAIVSTDGDSDRPLILGLDPRTSEPRFFGGDLVGMVVAEYLHPDAVVVPISCNDAIDRGSLSPVVQPKTKIGSPYVIAGMEQARRKGKKAVCGWEANGGFLTGSEIHKDGRILEPLSTRDAVLPILCVLFAAYEQGVSVPDLFDRLPRRFSRAALIKKFPRPVSLKIIERFTPRDAMVQEVAFTPGGPRLLDGERNPMQAAESLVKESEQTRTELSRFFSAEKGFGAIERLNYTDGVRILFGNGDVAHFRASGNADEFRIYAVADSQERANDIAAMGVAEPDGILTSMKNLFS